MSNPSEELISIVSDYAAETIDEVDYEELDQLILLGASIEGLPHTDSPLMLAIFANDFYLASYLLEKGADPNAIGGDAGMTPNVTPLLFAIGSDDLPEVNQRYAFTELLLTFGADPNLTIDELPTPLLQSILNMDVYMVDLLLAYGADPNLESMFQEVTLLPIEWATVFAMFHRRYVKNEKYREILFSLNHSGSTVVSPWKIYDVYDQLRLD